MKFQERLTKLHPLRLIGLGGVSKHESARALTWGRFFSFCMLLVGIWLLFQWQMERQGQLESFERLFMNIIVWLYFVIELSALTTLVHNKQRYLLDNWLILLAIVAGVFTFNNNAILNFIFVNVQPLFALAIMLPSLRILFGFLADGKLATTLVAAVLIIIVFGVLVAGIDPSVKTVWDGIWWAVATVSTVGYGDVVPSSLMGRILGTILVFVGLGLFVVITANFLALFLKRDVREFEKEEARVKVILEELEVMRLRQDEIYRVLKELQGKKDDAISD